MFSHMARHGKMAGRILKTLLIGLIVFIAAGNLSILGANLLARATFDSPPVPELKGVGNLAAVDDRVWRGGAPSEAGYRALADNGVRTIVDLRAEADVQIDHRLLDRLGLRLVSIPLRDGQAPQARQVNRFLRVVQNTEKRVYVHCGAGVGRTGTMAAAYLVKTGKADAAEALARNLSVGPPSLEQISFVAELGGEGVDSPPAAITLMSRVIDGPRRMWVNVTNAYEH